MNYCEFVRKICADPTIKISAHLGRDIKVKELLALKVHVNDCIPCQNLLDELNAKYPANQEFYKGELN